MNPPNDHQQISHLPQLSLQQKDADLSSSVYKAHWPDSVVVSPGHARDRELETSVRRVAITRGQDVIDDQRDGIR